MGQLNFDDLIEPYAAGKDDAVELLRIGLAKEFGRDVVDAGMSVTFSRMARGKKFEGLREVGQYTKKECQKQVIAREKAMTRVQQANLRRMRATPLLGSWRVAGAWLSLGFMLGLFIGQWQ